MKHPPEAYIRTRTTVKLFSAIGLPMPEVFLCNQDKRGAYQWCDSPLVVPNTGCQVQMEY